MLRQICRPFFIASILVVWTFDSVLEARAKSEVDPVQVQKVAAMLPSHAVGLGKPATDRAAWNELARTPVFEHWLKSVNRRGPDEKAKPTDELFLDFSRTGNRDRWQNIAFNFRGQLGTLALAECLENQGAFIKPLEDVIASICAEHTWVYPAHDRSLGNFKETQVDIDLGSSRIAWELATIKFLLGNKLSPVTQKLIHDNLQRRIFNPYKNMVEGRVPENGWLKGRNNWNAVCHAGVVGAALAEIDSPHERAWFVVSSQNYLTNFLNGFGKDGYCSEGMGYWNYGFGHYLMLSEAVRQSTGGKLDWMADPAVRLPALFGRRAELLNGIYPSIADCHPGSQPDPQLDTYLCRRLGLTPCNRSRDIFVRPASTLFTEALFCFLPEELPVISGKTEAESPLRTWFSESGILICRQPVHASIPFAVSLKGGHNNENHNHNDLGSFIVVVNHSIPIVDPGSEVYTARTFGPNRYDSDVLNSFGHDVPVIGGKLQSAGAKHRAKVTRTEFTDKSDTLALDITSAYAVPSLTKLQRTFSFNRGESPSLTVTDDVELTNLETFETALVTWGKWEQVSASELLFTEGSEAVRVKVDTGGIPFELKSKQLEADVTTPTKATRIGLLLKNAITKAHVVFTIQPVARAKTAIKN
jgi:hypothetical protein